MDAAHLVVFDLDGTLVDSSQDLTSAFNAALARLAPRAAPLSAERVRTMIGGGARNLVARGLAAAQLDRPVEEVLPLFLESYRSCLLERTRCYPGVEETLDRLAGYRLAVLSNKPGDLSREILEGLGLAGRFFRIYGVGDVPGKKPDPAGLYLLLAEAGAAAREAVIVGDSAVDVRTGRAAGIATVGVSYGFDPDSFVNEPPDFQLADLRELPNRLTLLWPA